MKNYQLGDFGSQDTTEYTEQYDEGLGFKIKIKKPKFKIKVKIHKPIKDLGKVTGNVLSATNPIKNGNKLFKAIPILKDIHREADKLTGGTFTKLERISELPSKLLKGKGISKAEIMEAVVTAIQVAAIVASGGSAAALVAAGAGMLKQGPLGKTSFGRSFLTVCEIAGAAAVIHSAAASQMAAQAAENGTMVAAQEGAKMTATDAAKKAVTNHATSVAKTMAEKEFEKKTGIPVGIATKVYNVANGSAKLATLPKDIARKVGEDQLKKAGLGDTVSQAIMSNNAAALGVAIKDAPNVLMTKAKRELEAQKVKLIAMTDVESIRKRAIASANKAVADAQNMEKLQAQIEKAATPILKKELENQFSKLGKQYVSQQKEALDLAGEAELETARASLKVAAAEEGRYDSNSGIMKKVIMGTVALAAVAGTVYVVTKD